MKFSSIIRSGILLFLFSCNNQEFKYDASGVFEVEEIIVSAEADGKIEKLSLREGDNLTEGQPVGHIDTTQLYLKKLQLQATLKTVGSRKPDVSVQLSALKEQISKAGLELNRIKNLLKDGAATQKQLEDAESHMTVLKNTLSAQSCTLSNATNGIREEENVYTIQIAQVEDMLNKSRIVNPVSGTVLNKYAAEKELAVQGKALYKIANMQSMFLRVYVIASQLNSIKTGQSTTVFVHLSDGEYRSYPAKIIWISDKAEFTPKTIQTKDERQNLVYAVKLEVENTDGLIKIGMYGDVKFKTSEK